MNNINKIIAIKLCQAQISSDAGKGLYRLDLSENKNSERFAVYHGYAAKERYIEDALKLISKNKTDYNFWVEVGPDQNGYNSYVVYFEFKLGGERYQISFHNPIRMRNQCIKRFVNKGRKTRWNKSTGSSVMSCQRLIEYYQL